MDRKTVFLSSTRSDLHAFRQAASEAIQRLGYYSEEMEVFGARDDSPLEVSLAKVSDSDIYIGLLGVFYGSVPPGHDRSFTEMEFDTAVQAGIPRLMFLTAEDWEPTAAISQTARNRAKQQAFRQRVMQAHTCDTFSSPDELAAKVTSALAQLETKRPRRRLLWPVVALLTLVVALVIVGGLLGVFRDGPEPQNTPVNTQGFTIIRQEETDMLDTTGNFNSALAALAQKQPDLWKLSACGVTKSVQSIPALAADIAEPRGG